MLLITRREGEAIVVNGAIEVRVLEIRGGRVKLGFEYPAGNTVFRQELFAKIQLENQAALASARHGASLQAALSQLGTKQGVAAGPVGMDSASKEGQPESLTNANAHSTKST